MALLAIGKTKGSNALAYFYVSYGEKKFYEIGTGLTKLVAISIL